jgi:hypothetical protein
VVRVSGSKRKGIFIVASIEWYNSSEWYISCSSTCGSYCIVNIAVVEEDTCSYLE